MTISSTGNWVKFLALVVVIWLAVTAVCMGWLIPQLGIDGGLAQPVIFGALGLVTVLLYNRMMRGGGNAR